MDLNPTFFQQFYSFLDMWLRFIAFTVILVTPAVIVGGCVIIAALLRRK